MYITFVLSVTHRLLRWTGVGSMCYPFTQCLSELWPCLTTLCTKEALTLTYIFFRWTACRFHACWVRLNWRATVLRWCSMVVPYHLSNPLTCAHVLVASLMDVSSQVSDHKSTSSIVWQAVRWVLEPVFVYQWLNKVSANERRCYICNISSHWLSSYGLIVHLNLRNKLQWIFFYQNTTIFIQENAFEICLLAHWGLNKMDTILQTAFLNALSWLKKFLLWLKFL